MKCALVVIIVVFFILLSATTPVVVIRYRSDNNDTVPAGNGNGTTTNDTSSPSPAELSGGPTRRSPAVCEYECPPADRASRALLLGTLGDGTVTCTFASGSCTYQTETGVLHDDKTGGQCPTGAVTFTPGCIAGDSDSLGALKLRAHKPKRWSRETRYEAIARRFLL